MNVCIILLLLKIVLPFCTIIVVRFQVYCRSFFVFAFTPTEILHEHKSKCCLFCAMVLQNLTRLFFMIPVTGVLWFVALTEETML